MSGRLAPDDLRRILKRADTKQATWQEMDLFRGHIAALEKERYAALADNAALVKVIIEAGEAMRKKRKPNAIFVAISMVGDVESERGHPGATLLEEHRKALVCARNEGLEKAAQAAQAADLAAMDYEDDLGASARDAARRIRALMEPESD